jgi:hypothetical protein
MPKLDYVHAVNQAGADLGITPRGIVIGFATVFVESDWLNYANSNVAASMSIPHDAVGSDHASVGLFQQQVVGPPWWWGDAATCMDPYKSATLFFQRLKAHNYNDTSQSPGSFAQAVQQSAKPDRYDQHMDDAQALYDQTIGKVPVAPTPPADPRVAALEAARPDFNEYPLWSNNNEDRNGTTIDLWLLHTEDGSDTDNADGLAHFLIGTEGTNNPRSYHYTISTGYPNDNGVTVVDVVDTDQAAWAVGSSNHRSINLCYGGSESNWDRQDWLTHMGRAIDVSAYLAVADCLKYNIDPKVIVPPYNSDPPGIADHRYCTVHLRDGNDHTDVDGPNGPYGPPFQHFPWDVFKAAVDRYWGIANAQQAPTPPSPAPAPPPSPAPAPAPQTFEQWLKAASDRGLLEYITAQLGPGDPAWSSTGSTLRDELWKLSTSTVQKAAKAATAQEKKQ